MKRLTVLVLLLFTGLFLVSCNGDKEKKKVTDEQAIAQLNKLNDYGIDLYSKGDYLPLLTPEVYSEQTSSYSRNGNNNDGFGLPGNAAGELNENNFMRPLLKLDQPGVVYRMWFTNWSGTPKLFIYIDGEPTYSLTLVEMASGLFEPFVKPLVYDREESSGGFVSLVPLVFKKSIEIIGQGDFYFNINYQKYPQGTILDYDQEEQVAAAKKAFENRGEDPKITGNDETINDTVDLNKSETKVLYQTSQKQTVTSLQLNFADLTVRTLDRTVIDDSGIKLNNGTNIQFNVEVDGNGLNSLRFRGVLLENNQTAIVRVDNEIISGGLTYRGRRLGGFEWQDDNYYADAVVSIPRSITDGKKEVTVSITATSDLTLYRAKTETTSKIDEIVFGDDVSKSNHSYVESKRTSKVNSSYEYDPNTLISSKEWEEIFKEEEVINNVWLKITYPELEEVAVYAPVSSFFGFGNFGMFETLGIMVGLKEDGTMYCYYPMPYEKGIKIELINNSTVDLSNIKVSVSHETNHFEAGTYGYFKANYVVHDNKTETRLIHGEPITFLNVEGSGKVVGITHSMSGSYFGMHSRYYLEGDEQIYIDGSLSHSFHGTGTEDFYNGGWYFKSGVRTNPTFGQSTHNYKDNRDRTVMIRTLMADPLIFRSEIDFKMEYGGANERTDVDVFATTYYYHASAVLEKTDEIYFTDEDSLNAHNYQTDEASKFYKLEGLYEGYYIGKYTPHTITSEVVEYSTFKIKVNPDNAGVILRREYNMKLPGQTANVYVDGKLVGIWSSAHRNALGIYVRQDDFYIPAEFSKNKDGLTIKIEVVPSKDSTIWLESFYEIYTIKKGD